MMFRKILVGNDGSEGGYLALDVAIDVAKKYRAQLHMIVVEELFDITAGSEAPVIAAEEVHQYYESLVQRAKVIASAKGIQLHAHLMIGVPETEISDFTADKNFDLLVVGFMEHSGFYNWLIGSTTDRLVDHVPCSVLVVK